MGDQLNILKLDQYALRIKFYNFCEKKKKFIDTLGDPDLSTISYRPLPFSLLFLSRSRSQARGVACILPKIDYLLIGQLLALNGKTVTFKSRKSSQEFGLLGKNHGKRSKKYSTLCGRPIRSMLNKCSVRFGHGRRINSDPLL